MARNETEMIHSGHLNSFHCFMTPSEYIQLALRTESGGAYYQSPEVNGVSPRIEHGAIGLVTESAEIIDAIKKAKFYGKQLDRVNVVEELGDCMWYLAVLCDELGVSFEDLWEKNIAKLKVRYPAGFTKQDSEVRDYEAEREVLG